MKYIIIAGIALALIGAALFFTSNHSQPAR